MKPDYTTFDGVDLPLWASEEEGNKFCSLLNHYIPKELSQTGWRYRLLYHYDGVLRKGGLYFHLIPGRLR